MTLTADNSKYFGQLRSIDCDGNGIHHGNASGFVAILSPDLEMPVTRVRWADPGSDQGTLFVRGCSDSTWLALFGEVAEILPPVEGSGISYDELASVENLARRILDNPSSVREFPGIAVALAVDRVTGKAAIASDRFGVLPVFWCRTPAGALVIATSITLLAEGAAWDLRPDQEATLLHLVFGYPVGTNRTIYEGIQVLEPAAVAVWSPGSMDVLSYWSLPSPGEAWNEGDQAALAAAFRNAVERCLKLRSHAFLLLTGGKDSLCIAAAVGSLGVVVPAGTVGPVHHTDVLGAMERAASLGFQHVHESPQDVIPEFDSLAERIAWTTAGRATATYTDLLSLIFHRTRDDATLLMGEGGENLRGFFWASALDTSDLFYKLKSAYMTPLELLRATLQPDLVGHLSNYPDSIIEELQSMVGIPNPRDFLEWFYVRARLARNFSRRHELLGCLRTIGVPFLDSQFSELALGTPLAARKTESVHRVLVDCLAPQLNQFWDTLDLHDGRRDFDYEERLSGPYYEVIRKGLTEALPVCEDVLLPEGVLGLLEDKRGQYDRAIWHLMRIYSYARFRYQFSQ